MAELEERFASDVTRTRRSRFRAVTDIAMGASLHHHYAYLTGRAVPGTYKLRYIDIAKPGLQAALAELGHGTRHDFFCLNDVNTPKSDQARITTELQAFLDSRFPFPSRWELSGR